MPDVIYDELLTALPVIDPQPTEVRTVDLARSLQQKLFVVAIDGPDRELRRGVARRRTTPGARGQGRTGGRTGRADHDRVRGDTGRVHQRADPRPVQRAPHQHDHATARYRQGFANYFEVLEAQQQLYQIRRDRLLTHVRLYRALGGEWNLSDAQWTNMDNATAR
jgi:hypothetical protein